MNLIFHVVATLGLIGLLYWVIKLQQQQRFINTILKFVGDEKSSVIVDNPAAFYEKFTKAFEIDLLGEIQCKKTMIKITPQPLIKFHLEYNIEAMQAEVVNGQTTLKMKTTRKTNHSINIEQLNLVTSNNILVAIGE